MKNFILLIFIVCYSFILIKQDRVQMGLQSEFEFWKTYSWNWSLEDEITTLLENRYVIVFQKVFIEKTK